MSPVVELKETKLLPSPNESAVPNTNEPYSLPPVVELPKQTLCDLQEYFV